MSDLDQGAIKEAMRAAGLLAPTVLMRRLRSGAHVFDLAAGPPDRRETLRVEAEAGSRGGTPTKALEADVEATIAELQGLFLE